MTPPLKILFAASEAAPFAKEGGLGDVVGALPRYLASLGHDVRLVMPRYYKIDRSKLHQRPEVLGVPMGSLGTLWGGILEGVLPGSSVPVYFIEHEGFFGRASLYTEHGESYPDNDLRFTFLSKASLELCRILDFAPDLIHVHDWHTAIIPLLLGSSYRYDPWVGQAASLLSIHNMQHQGNFPKGLMNVLGVGWQHFNPAELESYDRVNLLKGGMAHATLLATVSEGYAREIQTAAYGYGLEGQVQRRAADLYGILNGVDYEEWNPETDPYLVANYTADNLQGKALCKADLQRRFQLPRRPEVPLFGLVSRLVEQKGVDILAGALHRLLTLDLQFVLLGNGEPWTHFFFGDIARQYPEQFACRIGYDNALAHQIEAGADFFVMPSRFEPCGLNQMYSLRYGTPPIVRATGGLDDSVENFNEARHSGTGFKFYDLTPEALFDTIGWATYTYGHNRAGLASLIRNGMAQRFTWEGAAERYLELYREAIRRRRGG